MEQHDVISAQPPLHMVDGDPSMSDDDSIIENLLRWDPVDFDLSDLLSTDDLPPPISLPVPSTTETSTGSMPPPPPPQVLIRSAESSDQPIGIGMARARTYNGNGEKLMKSFREHNTAGTSSSKTRKKYVTPEELAELFKTDPQRANRIVANRNAAARSKERRSRYALAVENWVQLFQIEKNELDVEVQTLQRNIENMSLANKQTSLGTLNLNEESKTLKAQSQSLQGQAETLKVKMYQNYAVIANEPCGGLVSQFSSLESASQQFPITQPDSSQAAPPEPQFYVPPPSPPPSFGEAFELFGEYSNGSNFSNYNRLN